MLNRAHAAQERLLQREIASLMLAEEEPLLDDALAAGKDVFVE